MIWLALIIGAALCAAILAPVFLGDAPDDRQDEEVAGYLAQIDALEAREDLAPKSRDAALRRLQRQVMARQNAVQTGPRPVVAMALALALLIGGAGLYRLTGTPDYAAQITAAETPTEVALSPQQQELVDLVAQLGERLRTDRADDPQGWRLYGRTLMSLGRYEEALTAFDRLVALSDTPEDAALRAGAYRYVQGLQGRSPNAAPGPSAADIDAAAQMSPDDRAAMIDSMVAGLAERLRENPEDPEGWIRLLRARKVLGQTEAAADDIARLKAAFEGDADAVESILQRSGWSAD